ncbi:hypothetical protein CPC08DRAFT_471516 [Agrocybe pediades]|nr:hypothetical protein CPC08DRAFT_471516 [Agrocybe pediades]
MCFRLFVNCLSDRGAVEGPIRVSGERVTELAVKVELEVVKVVVETMGGRISCVQRTVYKPCWTAVLSRSSRLRNPHVHCRLQCLRRDGCTRGTASITNSGYCLGCFSSSSFPRILRILRLTILLLLRALLCPCLLHSVASTASTSNESRSPAPALVPAPNPRPILPPIPFKQPIQKHPTHSSTKHWRLTDHLH